MLFTNNKQIIIATNVTNGTKLMNVFNSKNVYQIRSNTTNNVIEIKFHNMKYILPPIIFQTLFDLRTICTCSKCLYATRVQDTFVKRGVMIILIFSVHSKNSVSVYHMLSIIIERVLFFHRNT